MKSLKSIGLTLLLLCLALPAPSRAGEIRLSAAASMTDAVKALAAAFTGNNPGVAIAPNFGSSGALAKQIMQGAPADLFISADSKWTELLVREGKIDRQTVRFFAASSLVLVGAPRPVITDLAGVASLARIAMGSPQSVPAGRYAAQVMEAVGIYAGLRDAGRLVLTRDVRQALLYAERGEVEGAFVYSTDALLARQATVLLTVPPSLHDPIVYPAGLTVTGGGNGAARGFHSFLTSPAALVILKEFGFSAPAAGN